MIWGQFVNLLIWFLTDRNPLLIPNSSQLSLGLGNLLFLLLYKHLVIPLLPDRSILYQWEYFLVGPSFLSRSWQVAPKTIIVVNHDFVSLPFLLGWPIILEKIVMITTSDGRQHIEQPLAISLTFLEMVDQSLVHWFFISRHINVVCLDEINKLQCDLQLRRWLWAATENEAWI